MGKFQEAWANITWVFAEAKQQWQDSRRSHTKHPEFYDMFRAVAYVSDPNRGFSPEEKDEIIHQAALREVARIPTNRDEARDVAMTAAYARYRWGSIHPASITVTQ